jgi:uncharacterized radical SAM superfamily protein
LPLPVRERDLLSEVEAERILKMQGVDAAEFAATVRAKSRPKTFSAVYPKKTMAVSVTGKYCVLSCAHCGGHYLKNMVDIADFDKEFASKRPRSILLSGGCNKEGAVPLATWCKELASRGVRMNVHPGITSKDEAAILAHNAQVISFDFVLDNLAIKEVFNGRWNRDDYIRTFRDLGKGSAKVVPHILIGLRKGKVFGEMEALKFLLDEGITKIIFIVFIPTQGTEWEGFSPPDIDDVARIVFYTRVARPEIEIVLGCMRPGGTYRRRLDTLLAKAVDGIVLPHPSVIEIVEKAGLTVFEKEECCAF